MNSLTPAIFFDRDGVVNASPGEDAYVLCWPDFHFLPGLEAVLRWAKAQGWKSVLVTNQQCVGKGLLSRATLDSIHARMNAALGELAFDDVQVCDHLTGTCDCRKPSPVMAQRAAATLGIDLAASWLVGDHDRDIEMARAASIGTAVRFLSEKVPKVSADHTVTTHAELLALLRNRHDHPTPL